MAPNMTFGTPMTAASKTVSYTGTAGTDAAVSAIQVVSGNPIYVTPFA